MMETSQVETELGLRLERLTGEEASCCVPEYRDLLRKVQGDARFRSNLKRAQALADERRLAVVALLGRKKSLCACEIQAALGVTHATVSHHMGVLENAGLVESERKGRWVYYRLAGPAGVKIP